MTLIDKAEALLPCPFCGWAEVFTSIYGRHAKKWGILCNGCDAWLAGYDSETAAVAAWNRRAAPTDAADELASVAAQIMADQKTMDLGVTEAQWQGLYETDPAPTDAARAREVEVYYKLRWIAGARPPVHPEPMNGSQTFSTEEKARAFFRSLASDAKFVSLERIEVTSTALIDKGAA